MLRWKLLLLIFVGPPEEGVYKIQGYWPTEEECVLGALEILKERREDPYHPPIIKVEGGCTKDDKDTI